MVSNDVLCVCPANPQAENREAYDYWKQNLQKQGKQPLDMVTLFREQGMSEYADSLEQFICKMEEPFEAPK